MMDSATPKANPRPDVMTDPTKPGREDDAAGLAREIAARAYMRAGDSEERLFAIFQPILARFLRAHDSEREDARDKEICKHGDIARMLVDRARKAEAALAAARQELEQAREHLAVEHTLTERHRVALQQAEAALEQSQRRAQEAEEWRRMGLAAQKRCIGYIVERDAARAEAQALRERLEEARGLLAEALYVTGVTTKLQYVRTKIEAFLAAHPEEQSVPNETPRVMCLIHEWPVGHGPCKCGPCPACGAAPPPLRAARPEQEPDRVVTGDGKPCPRCGLDYGFYQHACPPEQEPEPPRENCQPDTNAFPCGLCPACLSAGSETE